MSKPRVFVSSTYYDLKYVRERIEHLINAYCLEPILFEKDSVYFHPNASLDVSCYSEVENCHMMMLIVGGRYGSLATSIEAYEAQVSITRKEYETARKKGIPVMIFIDQNVYTEYKTYQVNGQSLPKGFKFAYVDDVKVFEFISALEGSGAIKTFHKIDDIEHYFSYQISGMLLAYLQQLQNDKVVADMKTAVDEIKIVSQSMQKTVNSIAEKMWGGESQRYKDLLEQQNHALIDFFIKLLDQSIEIERNDDLADEKADFLAKRISDLIIEFFFHPLIEEAIEQKETFQQKYIVIRKLESEFKVKFDTLDNNVKISINVWDVFEQVFQVVGLLSADPALKEYFRQGLKSMIGLRLVLPF